MRLTSEGRHIAQDRADEAGQRALYLWSLRQSQNENFRGPLFVLCSRPKLGWARKQLEEVQVVDRDVSFRRIVICLGQWCGSGPRLGPCLSLVF